MIVASGVGIAADVSGSGTSRHVGVNVRRATREQVGCVAEMRQMAKILLPARDMSAPGTNLRCVGFCSRRSV
jgi:hypothetical protein